MSLRYSLKDDVYHLVMFDAGHTVKEKCSNTEKLLWNICIYSIPAPMHLSKMYNDLCVKPHRILGSIQSRSICQISREKLQEYQFTKTQNIR